ncbi:MAG: hypothetical protein JOZ92_02990 [Candidatus Dormibacteraeota bacterium]|nr:hypothetical protein [Candidatus Dormibacteraeota bacterium]
MLRPLAEQIAPLIADGTPVHVLDGDCGELEAALRAAAQKRRVVVVERLDDALRTIGWLAALCTLGDADETARHLARLASRGTSSALAVWDAAAPPAHEQALLESLRACHIDTAPLQRYFTRIDPSDLSGFAIENLRDVARFDGFTQCWDALVLERIDSLQLRSLSPASLELLRHKLAERLRRYAAADDTLRIPFAAALLTAR